MIYDAFKNGLSENGKINPGEERELGGFKTLSESVELSAKVKEGSGTVKLYGIDKSGARALWREDKLTSDIAYVFDPISLSVYSGFDSFSVAVLADGDGLILSELTVKEKRDSSLEVSNIKKGACKHSVPNKMLFMGNSLLLGLENSFGMCSSAPDKDYYYYVSTFVGKINPKCEFKKLHGSGYEHCESYEAFEKWWNDDENIYTKEPSKFSFTDDLDLIVLQFGDNINTEAKFAAFKADKDVFIERVRKACPNARILLVHGWYNREPVFSDIVELCEKHGIERIDIRDLRSVENEARDLKEFRSVDGSMKPVKETWITHPGDLGMKAIGERIIEFLAF